jgi:hypothetical protein
LREVRRGGFQRFQALSSFCARRGCAREVLAQRVVRHALFFVYSAVQATLFTKCVGAWSDALNLCSRARYEHSASDNVV